MLPVRLSFDTTLPVVASQTFAIGDRSFSDGDVLPWRELGIDEAQLHAFWRSGLVRFVPTDVNTVAVMVTPGERVTVQTPKQQRARK